MADPPILLVALLMGCDGARHARDGADGLAAARRESRAAVYEPPLRRDLDGASRLFEAILAPCPDLGHARALAAVLELEVIEIRTGGETIVMVREAPGARRGRGFFAFRIGRRRPVAIEAPHSFSDRYTGPIAEKLFVESGAAAAAWNTASRSAGSHKEEEEDREREREREREGGQDESADLAHLPESFFQEFTRAFARAHADGIVLQLHGFDAEVRGADGPCAILSDATRTPESWVATAAGCLGDAFDRRTALYPRDAGELGGTSNAQAKLLRALGSKSFLHLELSLDVRADLAKDASLRRRLLLCIPEKVP